MNLRMQFLSSYFNKISYKIEKFKFQINYEWVIKSITFDFKFNIFLAFSMNFDSKLDEKLLVENWNSKWVKKININDEYFKNRNLIFIFLQVQFC